MGGQLCYSLNLTAVKGLPRPDQGRAKGQTRQLRKLHKITSAWFWNFPPSGLTLAVDYNLERGLTNQHSKHHIR